MQGQIFISYRRATDAWAVEQLRQELVGAFGEKNVFLDKHTIGAGEDWSQQIDQAIREASAVVVIFSKAWYGEVDPPPPADADATGTALPHPPSLRRIDDPTDKLRIELEMAGRHGRNVFPVIVDGSLEPRPEELPESVRFVCKRQFLRIDVSGNFEAQMDRLIGDIRQATMGHDWLWRLSGQALWLGLLALSLVVAWHSWAPQENYRNAYARMAMALRDRLVVEPPNVAVVEMGDAEYREMFGGRNPLDPELVRIMLTRLREATSRCDRTLPIVLNLDIAPTTQDTDAGDQARMTDALLNLAACRPVVLACPPAVRRGAPAWHEMRWMNTLRSKAAANPRIHLAFGTGMADPEGLRRAAGRSEIGVVAADIAAGRKPFAGHDAPECVCPSTPKLAAACAEVPLEREWDDRGFAVPLPGSSDTRGDSRPIDPSRLRLQQAVAQLDPDGQRRTPNGDDGPANMFSLNRAILQAEALLKFDAIVVGSNRSQSRHAVPGRPRRAFEGVSATVVQAHLLNGALNHEPVRGHKSMVIVGLLASWMVAVIVLLAGLELERNDQRYSHRGGAYLLFILGLAGVPILTLVVGAHWPAWIWWLALVALVAMLTAARAVMSCFEIVLNRGLAWRWPLALHREYLHGNAKASTLLRLATFALEGMIIVTCWVVIVMRQ